jgi:hypothetical protein
LTGIDGENGFQSIERWRTDGSVFSAKRSTEDFYPAFQFGPDLRPLPIVGKILGILWQHKSRSDWDNALWLVAANDWLDGPSPIDLFLTEPELVLYAAEQTVLPHIE